MDRKEILSIVVLLLLFIAGALTAHFYGDYIESKLDLGVWGMLIYVVVTILATVVAPLSTVPLIPLVVAIWGPLVTSLLNVFSWGVGSVIAFGIARRYGKPIVRRFIDMNSVAKYERALGENYLFWNVLILRALIPVDILSYAIGIFTNMKFSHYVIATFVGITPFAFILPYALEAPLYFQIFVFFLVLLALYIGYRKVSKVK
ncbi:MAG: VTT domain-containing protein [Parcubacteria group bacterium]